jgi:cyclophilin family peptidyl-prolyl cis-trans isomerase
MGKRAQFKRQKQLEVEKSRKQMIEQMRRSHQPWLYFWRRADFWIYLVSLILLVAYPFVSPKLDSWRGGNPTAVGQTALIKTSFGNIEMELYKKDAPKTVDNFCQLAKKGYYDNLTWHRVVKGFVIQGGDPNGDGTGGESVWGGTFADEINPKSLGLDQTAIKNLEKQGYKYDYNLVSHKLEVGSVAMANSGPNTNGSQFFIVTDENQPQLDGKHTVFGKVIKGMEVVRQIAEVPVDSNDKPTQPVNILSIEIK